MRIQTLSTVHRQVGERTNDLLKKFTIPGVSRKRKIDEVITSGESDMKRAMLKPQAVDLEDW